MIHRAQTTVSTRLSFFGSLIGPVKLELLIFCGSHRNQVFDQLFLTGMTRATPTTSRQPLH